MKTEFLAGLADALEVDESVLMPDYRLEDSEMWDSMTVVSVIALIDEHYGKSIQGDRLTACETVADIQALVE